MRDVFCSSVPAECGGIPEMLHFPVWLWVQSLPWCRVNTSCLEGHVQFGSSGFVRVTPDLESSPLSCWGWNSLGSWFISLKMHPPVHCLSPFEAFPLSSTRREVLKRIFGGNLPKPGSQAKGTSNKNPLWDILVFVVSGVGSNTPGDLQNCSW